MTFVEDLARNRAGQPGLREGFIDHYLTGVVYPERDKLAVLLAAAATVAGSWACTLIRWHRRAA